MADIEYLQNETQQRVSSMQNNMEQLELITNQAAGIRPQMIDIQTALQTLQQGPELRRPSDISTLTHPAIRIPATVYRQQTCRAFCMCRCHRKETLASPS